jgi:hypothetical protein
MPDVYKISAMDPDGVQRHKTISLTKYSQEDAVRIGNDWKMAIKAGKTFTMPPPPKPSAVPAAPEPKSSLTAFGKHSFKMVDIDDLEMPPNGGASFAMIGSTRSGKSTAMCYVWEKFFNKHITLLMTHSTHADIYKSFKKHAAISEGYHRSLITEPMKINRETNNHYKFCLIFDDLAMSGKTDTEMTKLLTIGRNSNMSAIICGQRLQMLNATGRSNVNFICCFRQNTDTATKDTVETYLRSYFPPGMSINDMCKLYKDLTADHHFFLIDTLNDNIGLCKIEV